MAVKINTIKDIRHYLLEELQHLYPDTEIIAMCNIIIGDLCGIDRIKILYEPQRIIDESVQKRIISICKELATGKPLQYVLGETVFYDCKIRLNEHVLIPRPETEELADLIIKENPGYEGSIIDFGTGSGCIAIALAQNLPGAKLQATDISPEALTIAGINAEINQVKLEFILSDIFGPPDPLLSPTGIIVSNPPYIRLSEKKLMSKNVLEFEPHKALFVPDNDPLLYYRALLETSKKLLLKNGRVYFEINEAMGKEMTLLLESYGFINIEIIKDINGKDRIAKGILYDRI